MIQKLYFKFKEICRELKNRYPRVMIMPRYLIRIQHGQIHPRHLRELADNQLTYAYDPSADIFSLSFFEMWSDVAQINERKVLITTIQY
jgi:hypothetical protein